MEKPIIYCDKCHSITTIYYDPIYRDGKLMGEMVRHWCANCSTDVRSMRTEIIKEVRSNGGI